MKKIILVILIGVFTLLLIVQATAKAETNPENFECLETLIGHSDDVNSVAFSQNNEWLASSSGDNTIKIWDTSNWSCIKTLTGHNGEVYSVAFSQNNKWFGSGSKDRTIKIWNTSDWNCVETLNEHSGYVYCIAFSSNNEWLASGSRDDTIKIWSTSNWSNIKTLNGHSNNIKSLAFSPNNQWLASGSFDDTIKIWDTSNWSEITTLSEHSDTVSSLDFTVNNEWLASASWDHTIKIWDTSDWSLIKTLTEHSDSVSSLDFSENNEWLASGTYDRTIKIWKISNWSCIKTLKEHTYYVFSVAFSQDNKRMASGSFDDTIKIWGEKEEQDWIVTGQEIRTNETILLDGNLIIENGGNLTFRNVTLIMNCSEDGEYGIEVKDGGKFYIFDYDNNLETKYDRSNITANNTDYEFKFLVNSGADFEMRNSELSECGYNWGDDIGGLTIKTDNIIIEDSIFYNNYNSISLYSSSNNQITNNNIYSNINVGVYLDSTSNNQITNNNVSNNIRGICVDFSSNKNNITNNTVFNNKFGIRLLSSNNNQIINNSVYSNNGYGIWFSSSNNNQITNNSVYSNNRYGIHLHSSNNIKMRNNTINNNKYNFGVEHNYYNDIDTSNTINGNPIIYIIENNNFTIDEKTNVGYLGFISCSNVTIKNLSLNNNGHGILFANTINSLIENCEISDNYYGIYLDESNDNQITNNSVYSNNQSGIYLDSSSNNRIANNNVSNNYDGIYLDSSSDTQITNSTIFNSTEYDFYLKSKSNITAINTTFDKNQVRIYDKNSELIVKWYLSVKIVDKNTNPISNANVRIQDNENCTFDKNYTTDSEGFVRWINLTEYVENKNDGKIYYTSHTITAEKDDVKNSIEIEMNLSKEITILLNYWVVKGTEIHTNETIILDGNLIIENGGNLTFRNVTLKMNCTKKGDFGIVVNDGGKFYIFDYDNNPETKYDRSNITANNKDFEFKFLVDSGSIFEMRNSELSECGYKNGNDGCAGLTIKTDNTLIENSNLYNNFNGIYLRGSSNNQITNDHIYSNNYYGIRLYSSNYNNISINNISNNDDGISLKDSSNNNTIINNNVPNNGCGISLRRSSNNNQITNNFVFSNYNDGFYIDSSNDNQITNNHVYSNEDNGITIFISSNNNQITNNYVYSNDDNGIELHDSNDNLLANNSVYSNIDCGIELSHSNNNLIINNSAYSNIDCGIKLSRSNNNPIMNSTITNSGNYDIYIRENSVITTINTTFKRYKVHFEDEDSELTVKWYLNVKVIDGKNFPIPNARIIVENLEGEVIYNNLAGLDGWVRWIVCTEYIQTQSGSTFYTNHKLTIEENSYLLNTKIINMDESKYLVIQPKPYNIFIKCDEPTGYTNPGELTIYEIKIINKGLKNDIIYLEIDNPSNWLAYLNSYYVIISSNEEKVVYLTIKPGKDEIEGETSIISVKGTSNGNVSTFDLFQVETTVNFVHYVDITQNLLEGNIDPEEGLKYDIQLENLGNGDEKIYLRKNSSQSDEQGDWLIEIETDFENLIIEIGESSTTSVTITPPSNATANEQKKLVFDIFSDDIYLGSFTIVTTVNQTHNIEIKCDEIGKSGKPLEIVTYRLNLTNMGNGEDTYYLELSGENIDWCDLSDTYISLKSNNYTEIYLNVSIPNNAKAWEKANITINVLSLDRTEKYGSINIITNVYQLFDLKIETENKEIFVEPGKDFEFYVTIENLGNGIDDITLSISGIPENWIIEPDNINTKIDSKSSITKSIKVTIPKNALVSEIANLGFTIKSNNNGDVLDYLNLTVYVNQNYEIELKCSNPEKEVIIGESEEYKIEVENKGNGKDSIILELSGLNSDWAYLSESVVILEAGESKNITLFVKSSSDAIEGDNAIINVIEISKNGNYSTPLTITTTLNGVDNEPPKADFKITLNNKEVTKVRIGELITFNASSSSDVETEIAEYRWDFDNGDIRYSEKVDYTYPKDTEPGEYTITLRVTDSNGTTTEKQMTIEVSEEEEDKNWFLYLILVVLVVIGILIVIMLNKVVKNLKDLGKARKSVVPTSEKVGVLSLDEEKRKEEDKRREMEMWKPLKEKPEPMIKVEEEKIEEEKEKNEDSKEGEEEKEIINEDDFLEKLKKEAKSEDDIEK